MWEVIIPAAASYLAGERRNEAQIEQANAQMAFQQDMSNTAYQRAVADMKAAGVNPMLSAKVGPSSSPQGAMAQIHDTITPAIGAGMSVVQGTASAKLAEAQEQVAEQSAKKIEEEIKNIPIEGQRLKSAVYLLNEQSALAAQQGHTQTVIREQLKATISKLLSETELINLDIGAAELLDNLGRESKQLLPVIEILKMFIRR